MAHYCIRYARNNGRFLPCSMINGIEPCEQPTSFPQNRGSLDKLLKHGIIAQSEDSFILNIWTPDTEGKKPVLFWIHGGAFSDGSSNDKQNDATVLASQADCVVVSVSYRLGLLGTAYFDEIPQQNCGMHDIITALEWTNTYIEKYNGDNINITIGGQSSGAWYAMALFTSSRLQHLFQKALFLSWPGTMKAQTDVVEREIYSRFLMEIKKLQGNPDDIANVPIDTFLKAQRVVGRKNKTKYKFNVPFLPMIEPDYVSDNLYEAIKHTTKKVWLQFTKNECGAYVYRLPISKHFPLHVLSKFILQYCPENAYAKLKANKKRTHNAYQATIDVTSDELFKNPSKTLAESLQERAELHEFDFPAVNPKTQCCHCFDIPFVFGCFDAWKESKILIGNDFETMKKESLKLQAKIKRFMQ